MGFVLSETLLHCKQTEKSEGRCCQSNVRITLVFGTFEVSSEAQQCLQVNSQ